MVTGPGEVPSFKACIPSTVESAACVRGYCLERREGKAGPRGGLVARTHKDVFVVKSHIRHSVAQLLCLERTGAPCCGKGVGYSWFCGLRILVRSEPLRWLRGSLCAVTSVQWSSHLARTCSAGRLRALGCR